ncbi:MAG: MYXO-CTERM sorting domain-containing protein [Sandaracinaceae bacterium]|nr:MYXO-CTERM sorting domain-containing protein [Sandaracinaceae bacterium]
MTRGASIALALLALAATQRARARPDTPGTTELFRYEATDVVESHPSPGGSFRVHYTRVGTNAVPARDVAGEVGVPDHVEQVAVIYDEVLAAYVDRLGFRAPLSDATLTTDNGGDERFDVYLLDFGGRADGSFRVDDCGRDGALATQCIGFMVQENDFRGYAYPSVTYANRLLASHELFHAVQAAYDTTEGSVMGEGTAVWASEVFDPTLGDLEAFADGFLDNPDRPLDRPLPGPIDPFSYGAGLFFRFLEERHDTAIVRALWEECVESEFLTALDTVLARDYGSSLAEELAELAIWNLYTDDRADPTRAYAEGERYPRVAIASVSLPLATDPPLRLFYASTQYLGASPSGRSRVVGALAGDVPDTVSLRIAVRRGSVITVAAGLEADAAGADEVIAIVTNTASSGESARPIVCLGDAEEVDACLAATVPMPDAGTLEDAGTAPGPDAGTAPPASGCACTSAGARAGSRQPLALLAIAALFFLRRRRQIEEIVGSRRVPARRGAP